jgi:hypothetical protein
MLADVAAGLRLAFAARQCPAEIKVGEQYVRDHGPTDPEKATLMRVVLVPQADGFAEPSMSAPGRGKLNPRPIKTRAVGFVAKLWAMTDLPDDCEDDVVEADYRMMDALINCTIACIAGVSLGIYQINGGEYVNDQATHVRRGIAYHMSVTIACPIVDVLFPFGTTTYREEAATAHVRVQTLLGDPQTYQTGAEFNAPEVTP